MSGKKVVECGVVFLIVAVLWLILMPVLYQGCRENPYAGTIRNLKQVGAALLTYAQDYDARLPPLPNAATARRRLDPYLKNETVWREPKTGRPYEVNRALSGARLARFDKTADRVVVFYEKVANERGFRAAAFLDGHVRFVREDTWRESKRASQIPTTADDCLAALHREAERENRFRLPVLDRYPEGGDMLALVVQVFLPALFLRVFAPRRPALP